MGAGLAGRAIAMVGIITGLLAVGLDLVTAGGATSRYLDHGVVVAVLIAALSMASYFPAEVSYDAAGTAAGTAAFGFYLFVPAAYAFDHLGTPGAAAWLGLCTVLIPIGWTITRRAEHAHGGSPPPARALPLRPQMVVAIAGLVLLAASIWLPAITDGPTFWNSSFSGHALGILMLLVVLVNAAVLVGPLVGRVAVSADMTLQIAAGSFGLFAALWLQHAFDALGSVGTGGWVAAVGALLLIGGVVTTRLAAARAPAAAAGVAVAQR